MYFRMSRKGLLLLYGMRSLDVYFFIICLQNDKIKIVEKWREKYMNHDVVEKILFTEEDIRTMCQGCYLETL